jgi:hypothetical protein
VRKLLGLPRAVLAVLAFLAFVVAGCSVPSVGPAAPASPTTTTAAEAPVAQPASVEVDKIGARSSLIPLGIQPNGEIDVPNVKTPQQAGWYSLGPVPGAVGPAVILGHIDGAGKPGIFYRLREIQVGDTARVITTDGRSLTFRTYDVVRVAKTAFPTDRVYGNTAEPELRLITCGGAFVGGDLGYQDNIIVFMKLDKPK